MQNNLIEEVIINGIQQVGVGCSDSKAVFDWYRKNLGFDVKVFEDEATATLMTKYTGGEARTRQAILAMNMTGGGGLEIWQYNKRIPAAASFEIKLGDLGINLMKIRAVNLENVHKKLQKSGATRIKSITNTPEGKSHFYFVDPFDNQVEIIENDYSFTKNDNECGGVMGVAVGVSNMEKSIKFYSTVLGYTVTVYDEEGNFDDLDEVVVNKHDYRRVLLRHPKDKPSGGFCKLLGPTEVELIQVRDRETNNVFENRYWGDLGFIHVCFDVAGMDQLRDKCAKNGYPFTVDSSNSFDMGDAAGHFTYVEDPDGTLIEFVETHKVPIMKKWNLYINLKKRSPSKPLPNWIVKAMKIHRVKG